MRSILGLRFLVGMVGGLMACGAVMAAAPQIAQVYPDFHINLHGAPRILTGEGFDSGGVEFWVWSPANDANVQRESAETLASGSAPVPATPPQGARRIGMMDVEPSVAVGEVSGTVLWAKNADGWSKPYVLDVARPYWINQDQARAGEQLFLYGFGLRPEHSGPPQYARKPGPLLAMVGEGKVLRMSPVLERRSTGWITDPRLMYFRVPANAAPGRYALYVHNGFGGELGWAKAGELEVVAPADGERPIVNVRDHGATGDGLANDSPALAKAMEEAAKTGAIVFLPPGTYRVDETVVVPSGVELLGAGRENTILEGSGAEATWPKVSPLVQLRDRTGLRKLTLAGGVGRGPEGDMMVLLRNDDKDDVVDATSITDCRLRATTEHPKVKDALYRSAISTSRCRRFTLADNEIHGALFFWWGERMDIVRNTWRDTANVCVIAIHGWAVDSLLDSNLFTDTPGRVCFYPVRHCHIRFNEIHQAFKGTWTNAEEVYLVHGTYQAHRKTRGTAEGSTEATLRDPAAPWEPGKQADSVVMILSGRGMGQYRRVVSNTADTLTLDRPWQVVPDGTSTYFTSLLFMENSFYANLNNTPGRMSLWLDCIANVVERHRDDHSKGIDVWGSDNSGPVTDKRPHPVREFLPSWYNIITNGWMDGAYAHLLGGSKPESLFDAPALFGNYVIANKLRSPHERRTGFDHQAVADGGIVVGHSPAKRSEGPGTRVGLSHNIIANNLLAFTNLGIVIGEQARKTFVLNNTFQAVEIPMADHGMRTVMRGNKVVGVDAEGKRTEGLPDAIGEREVEEPQAPDVP